MPFYFANPRSGGTVQQGRTDRIEYQRTAATQVMISAIGVVTNFWILCRSYIHAVMQVSLGMDEKEQHIDQNVGYYPNVFPLSNCLPIRTPNVALAFDSFNPPRDVLDKLSEMGADVKKVSGHRGDVYTIRSPTHEQLLEIMSFPQLDRNFRPIMDHITPYGINAYLRILTILSALSLTMINALNTGTADKPYTPTVDIRVVGPAASQTIDNMDTEEGEIQDKEGEGCVRPSQQMS